MSKIVIAIGGNALGDTPLGQLAALRKAAGPIARLVGMGHTLALVHGNGPQVGAVSLAMEFANSSKKPVPYMPFPECGAMTQGYIGFHFQNILSEELRNQQIDCQVATVITQTVVDPQDPAFQNPTKPIGTFYTEEERNLLVAEKGYTMVEDAGRGYRRVVPSPLPVDIVEKDMIFTLMEKGYLAITCGGGGIPVIRQGNELLGVQAVIDKDFAAARLASLIDADCLFLLTAVDRVAINWGKPNQENLARMTVAEARRYIGEGQFAPGSMLPKIESAIGFVDGKPGKKAIVASLDLLAQAMLGESGTAIVC